MTKNGMSRTTPRSPDDPDRCTVLIEPRSLTRQCLAAWLEQHEPAARLCALDAVTAAVEREETYVALIVWSIGYAGIASSGFADGLERLRQRYPTTPLALLADREDPANIRAALRLGVNGYVPTSFDRQDVLEVLRFVRAGGTYVPASALIGACETPEPVRTPAADRRPNGTFGDLTPREADVVERLKQGKPNKVIAHELEISESTVKVFVHRILHKLGAVNRTEVAYLAQQEADRVEAPCEPIV